jgi:hypothetical protein
MHMEMFPSATDAATNLNSTLNVRGVSAANVQATVKGAASQSADLQQWQNSGGNKLTAIDSAGKLQFADGAGGASDTNLYRSAADTLKTDDRLIVGDKILVGGSSEYGTSADLEISSSGNPTIRFHIPGGALQALKFSIGGILSLERESGSDPHPTFKVGGAAYIDNSDSGTKLYFGSAADTNLYRASANTLKTDDDFYIVGNIYPKQGTAAEVSIGNMGPSGESGIKFGSAGDTNLYRGGTDILSTDDSLGVAKNLRVGGATTFDTNRHLQVNGAHPGTGVTVIGIEYAGTFPSTAINRGDGLRIQPNTAASAFTIARINGVMIENPTKGAGSTITDLYGLNIEPQTQGTNSYGAAIGAASTQTLWISSNANNTTAAAGIAFGSSRDTNLYRSAADTLKTDDNLVVAGTLTVTGSVTGADDIAPFGTEGTLTVRTGKGRFRLPFNATIVGVSAAVDTAPTGSAIVLDVNKNGTTIFTNQANRPTIAANTNAAAEVTNMDITALATGDYLTVDIDQIGSTVAGADLTVFLRYRKA